MQTTVVVRSDCIRWKNDTWRNERVNGPSIIDCFGYCCWTNSDGYAHREDGPAVLYNDGTVRYFLKGLRYTEPDFRRRLKELQCQHK